VQNLPNFCKFLNQYEKKMSDNEFMNEDFERVSYIEQMYLLEKEREMIAEWQQWEEEQKDKVAKIRLIMPNIEEYDEERQTAYKEGQ
jgi:hypothetical protein